MSYLSILRALSPCPGFVAAWTIPITPRRLRLLMFRAWPVSGTAPASLRRGETLPIRASVPAVSSLARRDSPLELQHGTLGGSHLGPRSNHPFAISEPETLRLLLWGVIPYGYFLFCLFRGARRAFNETHLIKHDAVLRRAH